MAATATDFAGPLGVAVDEFERIVIVDSQNQRIRRVEQNGTVSTVAGTGIAGYGGDGGDARLAQLSLPFGVAVDGLGRVAISDLSNQRIRRIDNGSGGDAGDARHGRQGA